MPATGMMPMAIPMFSNTWKPIMPSTPTQTSVPNTVPAPTTTTTTPSHGPHLPRANTGSAARATLHPAI